MPKEKEQKTKRQYKKEQIIIMLVIILCCIMVVSSFGRYVVNEINNFFLKTNEFYFYSDKLKEKKTFYQIDNWTGIDSYTITINMNSRKNNLKKAMYDIGYNISYTCTSNATCQLSKTSGIILSSTNDDYFNLIITPNTGLKTGDKVTVEIEATSTTEYTKTLKAVFTLVVGKEKLSYEIVDKPYNKYLELNITNALSYYKVKQPFLNYNIGDKIDVDTYITLSKTNQEKCYSALVTLNFNPQTVLLDMTNENYINSINSKTTNINGSNYINSITFKVDPIASAKVRFYKQDITKDYTYPLVNSESIIEVITK